MEDEPEEEDEEDLYAMPQSKQPVASTSSRQIIEEEEEQPPMDVEEEAEEVINARPGVKEGKRRLVLEMEDGFEEDEEDREVLVQHQRGTSLYLLRVSIQS